MSPIRPELESLPARMVDLPRDERNYPVPWFVQWIDGKPEFRAMDARKFVRAIKEKLCWVCGERLGVNFCFVAGPMCGINRTSSEPPCHADCARWSARNCPFLNNPKMVRREDGLSDQCKENIAGFGIMRNPGVAMLWFTRSYEVFKVDNGYLLQMGDPQSLEWWRCGRPATRAEIDAAIDSGLPNLEAVARLEKGGLDALARNVKRFERYLPEPELVP